MKLELRQWDVVKVRINPDDRDEHPAITAKLGKVSVNRRRPLHQTIAAALRLFQ